MDKIPYIRVGTTYYKQIEKPLISGDKVTTLAKWTRKTIITDHNAKYLSKIPLYDGFCCIPSHLNFKQEIDGFYNTYNEIPFQPVDTKVSKDELKYSLSFIRHIFGNQAELGLDYLKLLFERPTQMLPILCLVSKERATGKSTFIKWMKTIFGFNMTYIKGDTFGSQFNADWASKLLVAIDEVFFDKKEITERLKFLSTTNKDKMEAKGKDRLEIEFFAKFILCSNNEDNFIQIDENEIRFWVLKIPSVNTENTDFLENLKAEIPTFLRYLYDRSYQTKKETRMWFKPSDIRTKALEKLITKNNKLETKMLELFYEYFEANEKELEIQVVPQDVLNMLKQMFNQKYWTRNDVRKLLKNNWKLQPQNNSLTYQRTVLDYQGIFISETSTGRYFTVCEKFIRQKFDELMK